MIGIKIIYELPINSVRKFEHINFLMYSVDFNVIMYKNP